MYRLVGRWASGGLDAWLASWLPTRALEKLVQGLPARQCDPLHL